MTATQIAEDAKKELVIFVLDNVLEGVGRLSARNVPWKWVKKGMLGVWIVMRGT